MHLVSCARPIGTLEEAPSTSLRPESDGDRWEGFWCAGDEGYYTRRTRLDGSEEWFRMSDDELAPAPQDQPAASAATRPAQPHRRVMLLVTRSLSARGMLVGAAHRKAR